MNKVHIFIAVLLLLPFSIIACDDNNKSTDGRAISENDLASNPDIKADPEKDYVVMFLEPASNPGENETGEPGFDIFTYKYKRTLNHTYCWIDPNEDAGHFMTLTDSDGFVVLSVEANGDCVTEVIPRGTYEGKITHDNLSDRVHPIFFQPQSDEELAKESGVMNKIGDYFASALAFLDMAEPSHAQDPTPTPDENATTLINTNSCNDCNLQGVDLSGVFLTDTSLTGADLTGANLTNTTFTTCQMDTIILDGAILNGTNFPDSMVNMVDLSGMDLSGADWTEIVMKDSDLSNTNFEGANLIGAALENDDFTGANLENANAVSAGFGSSTFTNVVATNMDASGADLRGTTWNGADLTGADFTNALGGQDFTGATWTDGMCICSNAACSNCR